MENPILSEVAGVTFIRSVSSAKKKKKKVSKLYNGLIGEKQEELGKKKQYRKLLNRNKAVKCECLNTITIQ